MSTPVHLQPGGDGTTPITPDEAAQLKLTWIVDHAALNAAEARTIGTVQLQLIRRPPKLKTVLDDLWLRDLHRRMFDAIWLWAGQYRATDRNIGTDPQQIATAVRNLTTDACAWFDGEDPALAAARLHHHLVQVHPFADGNGRHARLVTDACLRAVGAPVFTWGARLVEIPIDERRQQYDAALRRADADGNLDDLIVYVQR